MLKAKIHDGPYIIGIDAENVKRLTDGQLMVIDLDEMGGNGQIVVMYGETLEDVRKKLEKQLDCKLPTEEECDNIVKALKNRNPNKGLN